MSDSSGNWFSKLFMKVSQPEPQPQPQPQREPAVLPRPTPQPSLIPGTTYKKGDLIGQKYKVYGILGRGGFGVVYRVYARELSGVYALKTFLDEYLADQEIKKRFYKELSKGF